jgi:hypothetical protein
LISCWPRFFKVYSILMMQDLGERRRPRQAGS